MALWQSIPFACVMLPLGSAAAVSLLPRRAARAVTLTVLLLVTAASCALVPLMAARGDSYLYPMGFIGAPWGNELRVGELEALLGAVFAGVMLLSALGGMRQLDEQILRDRHGLYDVTLLLLCASLMAQTTLTSLRTGQPCRNPFRRPAQTLRMAAMLLIAFGVGMGSYHHSSWR